MKKAILFIWLTALLHSSWYASSAMSKDSVKVVVSFSILADMVRQVGGNHIEVTSLVGSNEDTHVYEPNPAAVKNLQFADLFIINGIGFEGWMERLVESANYQNPVIVATEGISLLSGSDDHHHDEHETEHEDDHDAEEENTEGWNPHAWQNLANGKIYVKNILHALIEIDSANAKNYEQNAAHYLAELQQWDEQIREQLNTIPKNRRVIITFHDALAYFGDAYGVTILSPIGMSTEKEPSAGEMAALIRQMREENVRVAFIENISDPRLVQQIAREADGVIGGVLYSDALSGPDGPANTYLKMLQHNAMTIFNALSKTL